MPAPAKIADCYAWVATELDVGDGILAATMMLDGQPHLMQLLGVDLERIRRTGTPRLPSADPARGARAPEALYARHRCADPDDVRRRRCRCSCRLSGVHAHPAAGSSGFIFEGPVT